MVRTCTPPNTAEAQLDDACTSHLAPCISHTPPLTPHTTEAQLDDAVKRISKLRSEVCHDDAQLTRSLALSIAVGDHPDHVRAEKVGIDVELSLLKTSVTGVLGHKRKKEKAALDKVAFVEKENNLLRMSVRELEKIRRISAGTTHYRLATTPAPTLSVSISSCLLSSSNVSTDGYCGLG